MEMLSLRNGNDKGAAGGQCTFGSNNGIRAMGTSYSWGNSDWIQEESFHNENSHCPWKNLPREVDSLALDTSDVGNRDDTTQSPKLTESC